MTKRQIFIKDIEGLLEVDPTVMSDEAIEFFNEFKKGAASTGAITENGKKILQFMQVEEESFNNIFKAKDIAEGIASTGRSVSGTMRKLVTDGYVEKIGKDPVCYSLTDKGREYTE